MTEQEIMESSAFKVLNHMIDQKAEYITNYLPWFKDEVNRLFDREQEAKCKDYLSTRTYEEGDTNVELPVRLHDLKSLVERLGEVFKQAEEINDLQRQKLRLLNDYDFTHGDNSEQRKIFG